MKNSTFYVCLLFMLINFQALANPGRSITSFDHGSLILEHHYVEEGYSMPEYVVEEDYSALSIPDDQLSCLEPSRYIEFSDRSCDYPENFGLIKIDEEWNEGETKYVYIKVKGPVCCGEILVNPKAARNCYNDLRIAGPIVLSDGGVDRTSLSEIGTYNPGCVSGLEKCETGENRIERDGHVIQFHGWENTDDGYSIWYYEVKSASGKGSHAISHLTFALVNSETSCGAMNSLGSLVWHDKNNNGLQDEGSEFGIGGIKVVLYKDGVATGQSQMTDNMGRYMFTGLSAGNYQVKFMISELYNFTGKAMGNGRNDSKADPKTGMSDEVALSGGEEYVYSDAGLVFVILPIILSDFTVEQNENSVLLTWETSLEIHSDYFEVQKSIDGSTFRAISRVEASNNSSSTLKYSSVDREPKAGANFYRLKQVDLDGTYSYSDVRAVNLGASSSNTTVFPNPFRGQVTIRHSFAGSVQGSIYNASGVEVRRITLNSAQSVLNLQDLDSGMYYILFHDGNIQQPVKLIKY